jgi:hypothetical protein
VSVETFKMLATSATVRYSLRLADVVFMRMWKSTHLQLLYCSGVKWTYSLLRPHARTFRSRPAHRQLRGGYATGGQCRSGIRCPRLPQHQPLVRRPYRGRPGAPAISATTTHDLTRFKNLLTCSLACGII